MIQTDNLTLSFAGRMLFENVNIKFTPGNSYGLIGANGAGKSTFLKCLSGEQEVTSGNVSIPKGLRLSTLRQNHFAFDQEQVLNTVIQGHQRLWEVMQEKDAIYAKPDFNDEDGMRAAELEAEFADMNGWEAEAMAAQLLANLGIATNQHELLVQDLEDSEKVRVLLAQALFGDPDVLLLDEPTNHLDVDSILWLEDFLLNFKNTLVVVSHDRHFLDKVCTHIADIDFQKVTLFTGNYTFWHQTSQMALQQRQNSNKKKEEKMKELKTFIARFSANASKSKQATSRKALLDKISLDDIKPSSRKYPYIQFKAERELGKEVLFVEKLSKSVDGEVLFNNLHLNIGKGERVAFVGPDHAVTALFQALAGEEQADSGTIHWGHSTNRAYLPRDSESFFDTEVNLINWMRQFTDETEENFVRSFLGRMLFSGDDVLKEANVLSGGEKMRCMLARIMLGSPNVVLLDSPTNHLDLESITALNTGLEKFDGTLLFTSHDVEFVNTLATRIIELDGDQFHDLHMGYDAYLTNEDRIARLGGPRA
ncbi:MAG: ATP-binding cassette domain-containing protein [Myxococcota bacterium]|nr:ATP-binding cassette domain-containing protein [Myxococcota bacterium]